MAWMKIDGKWMHSTQNANDQNQSVVVSPQRQNSPASAAVSMRRHSGPGKKHRPSLELPG